MRYSASKIESGSERIPRSVLRGKRANGEHNYSLWIEDSPQFTAESFNFPGIDGEFFTNMWYKRTALFCNTP